LAHSVVKIKSFLRFYELLELISLKLFSTKQTFRYLVSLSKRTHQILEKKQMNTAMKQFRNTLLAFAVLLSTFSFTSCCKEVLMLCDLLASISPVVESATNVSILSGVEFVLRGVVKNELALGDCEDTGDAAESKTAYQVQFRTGPDAEWQFADFELGDGSTMNIFRVTTPILAGSDENVRDNTYAFVEAGEYRFIINADDLAEVEERNEDNNGGVADGSLTGKMASRSMFTLQVVNPDGTSKRGCLTDCVPVVKLIKSEQVSL